MLQYRVFFRAAGGRDWAPLEPGVHTVLYNVPEAKEALEVMRQHPAIAGICVKSGDALLNIMVFDQPALAHKAFPLNPPQPGDQT